MSKQVKIDVNQDVTSRLAFEPIAAYNNMCLGFLKDVRVEETESKEDAKWEFSGHTVARLVFEFVQLKDVHNNKDRFFTYGIMPVQTKKTDGDRTDKDIAGSYVEMWRKIKHIHDQYVTSPNYAPISLVPEFDYDKSVEDRLADIKTFFQAIAASFQVGKDKATPIYMPYDNDKKVRCIVMKLVASGQKNAYLSFPDFTGKGFVEVAVLTNGKLDTALKFTGNETAVVGSVAIGQRPSTLEDELPAAIQAMMPKQ